MSCPVFVVDDDHTILEAVKWLLEGEGLQVETFSSSEAFINKVAPQQTGVLVLDINMPGMDGIELQNWVNHQNSPLVIIFLTGHADVEITKLAFKHGANDLLQKPVNAEDLYEVITKAQALAADLSQSRKIELSIQERFETLTKREKSLIPLIIEGHPNKVIADRLFIALRTTEIHRHNLFKKMKVSSGIQLAYIGQQLMRLLEEEKASSRK